MSKAILVMDMPERCEKCCFRRGWNVCKLKKYLDGDKLSTIYTVDKQIMDNTKPDWCPLRPMPEKMECPPMNGTNYEAGWNACIDAIGGGDGE